MMVQVKLPDLGARSAQLEVPKSTTFVREVNKRIVTFTVEGADYQKQEATVISLASHLEALAERKLLEVEPATIPVTISKARVAVGSEMRRCPSLARVPATKPEPSDAKVKRLVALLATMTEDERTKLGF